MLRSVRGGEIRRCRRSRGGYERQQSTDHGRDGGGNGDEDEDEEEAEAEEAQGRRLVLGPSQMI